MENIANQVRPSLFDMVPYSPGKPIAEVQREFHLEEVIKLASNENPFGASEKVKHEIMRALVDLHRYPDGAQYQLKQAIAAHFQVPTEWLLVGNGSDEIIKLLCETLILPGDEIIYPTPSFSEYEFGARLMDAALVPITLRDDFTYDLNQFANAVSERTKIIFLCSPNNPTGTYIPFEELEAFLQKLPQQVVVVIDEAYIEYAEAADCRSAIEFIHSGYPVVSMRTFSKAYGLASLRVGYCIASPQLIDFVNRTREPFNVNHLAQVAAVAALEDQAHVQRSVEMNQSERRRLTLALTEMGMRVIPSQTNFILFDTGREARPLFEQLLQRGVIVRVGFAGLPTYVRLSIGTPEENDAFLTAFQEVFTAKQL